MAIRAFQGLRPLIRYKGPVYEVSSRQASLEELQELEARIMERRNSFGFVTDPEKATAVANERIREARALQMSA